MPFREKLKKAFKSSPSSSKTNSPNPDVSAVSPHPDGRWPSNVYAPGEEMPRPKYRAPVKKEHKDKLDSFRFGQAWRRKSHQSVYSPMGSRMPSRRGSLLSRPSFSGKSRKSVSGQSGQGPISPIKSEFGADALRRRSVAVQSDDGSLTSKEGSRTNSVSAPSSTGASGKRFPGPHGAARATRLSAEIEQDGDDDVANVGLSRVNSQDKATPSPRTADERPKTPAKADSGPSMKGGGGGVAYDHKPFTEEDLTLAIQRSHLSVPSH